MTSKTLHLVRTLFLFLITGCGMADMTLFRGGSGGGGGAWSNMLLSAGPGPVGLSATPPVDASGNRYIIGTTTVAGSLSSCSVHGTIGGANEPVLAKVSTTGNLTWCVRFGGLSGSAVGVVLDNTNGVGYLYGVTDGTAGTQLVSAGLQDAYIARFSQSTGSVAWISQMGAGGASLTAFSTWAPPYLSTDKSTLILSGATSASGSFGGTQYGVLSGDDYFVSTWSASTGALNWVVQRGLAGTTGGIMYSQIEGSEIAVVGTQGTTRGFLAKYALSNGAENTFVTRGAATTSVTGATLDTSGKYVVFGQTGENIGTQSGVHGTRDGLVEKWDTDGTVLWSRQIGGGAATSTTATYNYRDASGDFIVSGNSTGTVGTQYGVHNTFPLGDTYTAKINGTTGALSWATQVGGGNAMFAINTDLRARNLNSNVAYHISTLGVLGADTVYNTPALLSQSLGWLVLNPSTGLKIAFGNWIEGASFSAMSSLVTTGIYSDNSFAICGTVASPPASPNPGTVYGTLGTSPVVAARFSSSGVLQWASYVGMGAGTTSSVSVCSVDSSDYLTMIGNTNGTLSSANQYGSNAGNTSIFVIRLSPTGAI